VATPSNASVESGALVRQWTWPLRMVFWWFVIGVCVWAWALAAQWFWALRKAPDRPVAYLEQVLAQEQAALQALRPGLFDPAAAAVWMASGIRDTVLLSSVGFARTLMHWPVAYRQTAQGRVVSPGFDPGADFVANEVAATRTFRMLLTMTEIFATRTAMFLSAAPLLLLAAFVGLVDGFVGRARRRASAGRESASLYHRAKLGVSFAAILGYVTAIGLPSLNEPAAILVPIAVCIGALLRLQAAFYKKYL
jgi:integrating conjugative element membrane protein (TIGR03747 family)